MFNAIINFKKGARFFFKGQQYIIKNPQFLKIAIIPLLAGFIVFGGAIFVFNYYLNDILTLLWAKPDSTLFVTLWYIAVFMFWTVSFLTAMVFAYLIFMIIAAPFNDLISEKIEVKEGTFYSRDFELGFFLKDAWHSVVLEIVKVFKKIVWLLFFYAISIIIPVIGQWIYVTAGWYKMSHLFGMDYVDWSLARRGYKVKDRFDFAAEHRWTLTGFGFMVFIFTFIPFGALITWPGSIAGGTLLHSTFNLKDKS